MCHLSFNITRLLRRRLIFMIILIWFTLRLLNILISVKWLILTTFLMRKCKIICYCHTLITRIISKVFYLSFYVILVWQPALNKYILATNWWILLHVIVLVHDCIHHSLINSLILTLKAGSNLILYVLVVLINTWLPTIWYNRSLKIFINFLSSYNCLLWCYCKFRIIIFNLVWVLFD